MTSDIESVILNNFDNIFYRPYQYLGVYGESDFTERIGHFNTYENCIKEVKLYGCAIHFVPKIFLSFDLCMIAVKNYEKALKFLFFESGKIELDFFDNPAKNTFGAHKCDGLFTYDIFTEIEVANLVKVATETFEGAIKYVPTKFKTLELLKELFTNFLSKSSFAMSNTSLNEAYFLKHFPIEFINLEMCIDVFKKNPKSFKNIPEEFKTLEMCIEAVNIHPNLLEHVPKNFRTIEMCTEAIKKGHVLEHVPRDFKTRDFCLLALEYGNSIRHVPDEFKTQKMCDEAVEKWECNLKFVPNELKTRKMCSEAFEKSISTINYIPDEFKTYEMCLKAVKDYGGYLKFVPDEFKTRELCLALFESFGWQYALNFLPGDFINNTTVLEIIKIQPVFVLHKKFPQELLTAELCLEAVKCCGKLLYAIPEKFKTIEVCIEAVKQFGRTLMFVPEKLRTREVCYHAICNDTRAFMYIPEAWFTHVVKDCTCLG